MKRRAFSVHLHSFLLFTFFATGCSSLPAGTTEMQVGSKKFSLEIADTDSKRETGLMYRDSMPADHGMIFIFPEEEPRSFWMKNTRIPLDIVYIDAHGKVVSVKQMKAYDLSSVPSDGPAKFAIELNDGAAAKAGVKAGDQLTLPKDLPEAKE